MAKTQVPSSQKATIVSKQGFRAMLYKSAFGKLLNSGAVFRPREFEGNETGGKQAIVYSFTGQLTAPALGRGQTAWGNEEALNIGDMTMRFGEYRKPVALPGKFTIDRLETNYNFDKNARDAIVDFYAAQIDYSFFNQAAGFNATTATLGGIFYDANAIAQVTGQNTIIAPSTDRILRAGAVANDQSLTAANRMSLQLLDYAVELLGNSTQQFGTLNNGAIGMCFMSFEQWTDLKLDSNSPVQWYTNALAQASGGDDSYLTSQGMWDSTWKPMCTYAGIDIYVSPRVAYGVNSSTFAAIPTVRRAVVLGKNAMSYASMWGKGDANDQDVPLKFFYQDGDYGYVEGIEGRLELGIKKNSPSNGSDFGTVVISTYAASHV